MADEKKAGANAERAKKGAAARAVRTASIGNMSLSNKFLFDKVVQCRRALQAIEDLLLTNQKVPAAVLQSEAANLTAAASLAGGEK